MLNQEKVVLNLFEFDFDIVAQPSKFIHDRSLCMVIEETGHHANPI